MTTFLIEVESEAIQSDNAATPPRMGYSRLVQLHWRLEAWGPEVVTDTLQQIPTWDEYINLPASERALLDSKVELLYRKLTNMFNDPEAHQVQSQMQRQHVDPIFYPCPW